MLEAKLHATGYDVIVLNKGISGEKSPATDDRFLQAIDDADIVLIMIGTNDIIKPESCPEPHNCRTIEHIGSMLDKALNSKIVPVVSTITPAQSRCARSWANSPIQALNTQLYNIAHERNVRIVDNHQAILNHGGGSLFSDCLRVDSNIWRHGCRKLCSWGFLHDRSLPDLDLNECP